MLVAVKLKEQGEMHDGRVSVLIQNPVSVLAVSQNVLFEVVGDESKFQIAFVSAVSYICVIHDIVRVKRSILALCIKRKG